MGTGYFFCVCIQYTINLIYVSKYVYYIRHGLHRSESTHPLSDELFECTLYRPRRKYYWSMNLNGVWKTDNRTASDCQNCESCQLWQSERRVVSTVTVRKATRVNCVCSNCESCQLWKSERRVVSTATVRTASRVKCDSSNGESCQLRQSELRVVSTVTVRTESRVNCDSLNGDSCQLWLSEVVSNACDSVTGRIVRSACCLFPGSWYSALLHP